MNTAQRTFFQLLRNSHKALPSEYVELPYIINPSTAYINTGFIPSYLYKIEVEIENLTPNRDGYSCPFGGIVATGGQWEGMSLLWDGVSNHWRWQTRYSAMSNIPGTRTPDNAKVKLTLEPGNQRWIIDDHSPNQSLIDWTTTSTGSTQVPMVSWYLFGLHQNTSITSNMIGSMGRFTVKVNGTEMLDYLPAMRISDSKVGMYDFVSKTFKTSDSEVDFVAPI